MKDERLEIDEIFDMFERGDFGIFAYFEDDEIIHVEINHPLCRNKKAVVDYTDYEDPPDDDISF